MYCQNARNYEEIEDLQRLKSFECSKCSGTLRDA